MNMHQLRHGVPADLTRTDGSGFFLPPAEDGRVPEASASLEINTLLCSLVHLAVAQAPHGHARKVAVAAVAHALALYGQHDHSEAAARVTRVLPSYADEDVDAVALAAYTQALLEDEGGDLAVPAAPPWHDMRTADEAAPASPTWGPWGAEGRQEAGE